LNGQSATKPLDTPKSWSAPEVKALELKAIQLQKRLEAIGYSDYIGH